MGGGIIECLRKVVGTGNHCSSGNYHCPHGYLITGSSLFGFGKRHLHVILVASVFHGDILSSAYGELQRY